MAITMLGHPTWILSSGRAGGDGDAGPLHFRLKAGKRRGWSSYIWCQVWCQGCGSIRYFRRCRKLPGRQVSQSDVGPISTVVSSPGFHLPGSVLHGQGPVLVQALLPESPVESLDEGVVRRLPRPAEVQLRPVEVSPPVYALHCGSVDGDEYQFVQSHRRHTVFEDKDVVPGLT